MTAWIYVKHLSEATNSPRTCTQEINSEVILIGALLDLFLPARSDWPASTPLTVSVSIGDGT